jgi:hypothetical protein
MGRAKAIAEDRWRSKVIDCTDMACPGILLAFCAGFNGCTPRTGMMEGGPAAARLLETLA